MAEEEEEQISQIDPSAFSSYPALFGLLWILGWIGGSIVYRLSNGKPVLFFGVRNALFQQRTASGHSHRFWLFKFAGAHNCLVVAVTQDRLIVRPWTPFNLMFLPEIYGLEHDVPLTSITSVQIEKSLLGRRVEVEFRSGIELEKITLYLRHPDAFLEAVGKSQERIRLTHRQ